MLTSKGNYKQAWTWHYRARLIQWSKQFKYSAEPRKHGMKPDGKSQTSIHQT